MYRYSSCLFICCGAGAGDGDEEIIIPLGTETVIPMGFGGNGGGGGGGFSIPLDPSMFAGPQVPALLFVFLESLVDCAMVLTLSGPNHLTTWHLDASIICR